MEFVSNVDPRAVVFAVFSLHAILQAESDFGEQTDEDWWAAFLTP